MLVSALYELILTEQSLHFSFNDPDLTDEPKKKRL